MIWFVFGAMASITALLFLSGLYRKGEVLNRKDGALAILKDQLSEIDADQERNLISGTEAAAAKVEIKRRILTAGRLEARRSSGASGRSAILASAIAVPLVTFVLYSQIGSPDIKSQPLASRGAETQEAANLAELTQKLKARLEADESGGPSEGWRLLGRTYMRMGRYDAAVDAFEHVAVRDDAGIATLLQFAEALIAAENGVVTPHAERVIEQAFEMDSNDPGAIFFRAQALEQNGVPDEARALLIDRLKRADRAYPWMEVFVSFANRLGEQVEKYPVNLADFLPEPQDVRGPSAADIEAAQDMSVEERRAFVRSMVDRLAARLLDDPDNLEGWLRLAEAYSVLGNIDAAQNAANKARNLAESLPETDPTRAAITARLDQIKK
ncbi:MAG: c-type cytochrome biogenesis protein CcmI [Roseovarius sp.]|jgi:cytochrome c-type biogenesis protein CcmH|uniref:c-type cytochrome biogenesis protein CcmI n=1 Tax=Roseovarius sp. TaxID=1486281 RepID=UPI000C4C00DF|nr:c-type cytochrome biogenesis protein CcmI [Roseovarius sp.]|tara:strand:- start:1619 stop:2770 length:1152 start_codon:yes stop_codon:yes gene_type:complete